MNGTIETILMVIAVISLVILCGWVITHDDACNCHSQNVTQNVTVIVQNYEIREVRYINPCISGGTWESPIPREVGCP